MLDVQPVLKPDLVLLDIKMPGKDGWEVLAKLRRRGNTPVVVVTALDQDIDRLQGLRIGADDYVVKPFNLVEVVARVGAVLRRTSASRGETVLRVGRLEVDTQSYVASVHAASGAVTGSRNRGKNCTDRFERSTRLLELAIPVSKAKDQGRLPCTGVGLRRAPVVAPMACSPYAPSQAGT